MIANRKDDPQPAFAPRLNEVLPKVATPGHAAVMLKHHITNPNPLFF